MQSLPEAGSARLLPGAPAAGAATFVVIGQPPAALALAASEVRRIVVEAPGSTEHHLDLCGLFGIPVDAAAPSHVLFVRRGSRELGLVARGPLAFSTVAAADVYPLPSEIAAPSSMSQVIASGGVPRIPVLDVARLFSDPPSEHESELRGSPPFDRERP